MRARPYARHARTSAPPLFGSRGGSRSRRGLSSSYVSLGDLDLGALPFGAARNYGSAAVEAWRDDVAAQAGDLPHEFLMAWIAYESGGNPCEWTKYAEAGIFQLMPPDNIARAGTTMAAQHPVPPCAAGAGSSAGRSSLTDDQAYEQVRAGIAYVNYCRTVAHALLDKYGYTWSESDWSFWATVKMVFNLPGAIPKLLQAGYDGWDGPPPDWSTMMKFSTPNATTVNAQMVGQYGEGGGSMLGALASPDALLIGGIAIGLWYLFRRS